MNNSPVNDDLTKGWPDEPGNAEIEAFARGLQADLPQLPEPALRRIETLRIQHETQQRAEPYRRAGLSPEALAASVLIGVPLLLTKIFRSDSKKLAPPVGARVECARRLSGARSCRPRASTAGPAADRSRFVPGALFQLIV